MWGVGCGVWGVGFGVEGWGLGFGVKGAGIRVENLGFTVSGFEFEVYRGFLRTRTRTAIQAYLAHKKHPPPRTLQQHYSKGPMVVLGGWLFLLGEGSTVGVGIPQVERRLVRLTVLGYLAHKKTPTPLEPPRTLGIL